MEFFEAVKIIAQLSGLLIVPLVGFVVRVSNRLAIIETHLLYMAPKRAGDKHHE